MTVAPLVATLGGMPTNDEISRRIVSARELRGVSQEELGRAMKGEGYGQYDVARIERKEHMAPVLHEGRRRALCRILRVPEWWFTADDDELFAEGNGAMSDLDRHMTALYGDLASKLDLLVEINQDHLLPYLAEQASTPVDEIADPRAEARSRSSSQRRRSGDPKDS